MSKYGVFSGLYFPAFGLNTEDHSVFSPHAGKYRPEKTPYLDIFHTMYAFEFVLSFLRIGPKFTSKVS